MPDKEILVSNLFEAGAMFKVLDTVKDNVLPPGSLGFVSFIRGMDDSYQNVAKTVAVIIRKGKSGKPRLMNVVIATPVFTVDNKQFIKLMPEEGTKKYYVNIKRRLPMAMDVMMLNDLEFLGYAVALSKRIKHMSEQCRHKKWPEDKGHPVNVFKRMPDHFEEDPETFLQKFANESFRTYFIEEARYMSSVLIRMQIHLDMTRAEAEVSAAEFLLYTNKGEFIPEDAEDKTNEYKFTDDNSKLERTIKFYQMIRKNITSLDKSKKKS